MLYVCAMKETEKKVKYVTDRFQADGCFGETEEKIRRGMMDNQLMSCICDKAQLERVAGIYEVTPHKTNTGSRRVMTMKYAIYSK